MKEYFVDKILFDTLRAMYACYLKERHVSCYKSPIVPRFAISVDKWDFKYYKNELQINTLYENALEEKIALGGYVELYASLKQLFDILEKELEHNYTIYIKPKKEDSNATDEGADKQGNSEKRSSGADIEVMHAESDTNQGGEKN